MNLVDIFQTANSNMMRSKLRSLLTIIAIFIGALTLTLTNGIGAGVSSYIDSQVGSIGADDVLIVQPNVETQGIGELRPYDPDQTTTQGAGNFAIPVLTTNDIDNISKQSGILSVEPMLNATTEYFSIDNSKYQTMLSPYISGMTLDLASGRIFDKDTSEYQTILPLSYINAIGLTAENALGKTVSFGVKSASGEIKELEARVVGVQQPTIVGGGGVIVSQTLLRDMRSIQYDGLPEAAKNQYTAAIARFDTTSTPEELQATKDALKEKGYQAMTVDDTIGIFKQVIDAIIAVLNFFAAIALLAASFGIVNTLLMAVQERTKEIGLMKAMGMRSNRVFMLFSIEAILLGFWGSLIGSLVGVGLGYVINRVAADSFLKDLPGFDLMSFPITSILTIMAIIMAIAFLAGTLPALRASKKDPIEALRYE